jgi:hypothetical protein
MTALGAVEMDSTSRTLEIRGAETGDYFGRPVLSADFDGDGKAEIVVASDRNSFTGSQRPTLYVFRGSSLNITRQEIGLTSETADLTILGETGSINLPTALAAGDVNGDGFRDLIAADSTLTASGRAGAGVVYVVFGGAQFFATPVRDFALSQFSMKILGATAGDDTGGSLMFGGLLSKGLACGDLDNDGIADMAIGAHLANMNSKTDSGVVRILRGRTSYTAGTTIDLATQSDAQILGNEEGGELGTAIVIGDLNGDNISDLVLGEEYGSISAFSSHGKVFIMWGRSPFPSLNLSTQSPDVQIRGKVSWDQLGTEVALADFNADGRLDLLATAPGWDKKDSASIDEGAVYGFAGKTTWPSFIDLATATPDLSVTGVDTSNLIGNTLAAGDFNGDGFRDFAFGTRDGERPGFNSEGRIFCVFARTGLPATLPLDTWAFDWVINGGADYVQLGDKIAAGDVDGDGSAELLAAAPFVNSSTGKLFMFDLNPWPTAAADWALFE